MNSFFSITTFSMYINNCFIHNSYPPQIPIVIPSIPCLLTEKHGENKMSPESLCVCFSAFRS